ncbi:hypothetical protein [Arsenicicoccus dermatophilus]
MGDMHALLAELPAVAAAASTTGRDVAIALLLIGLIAWLLNN